MPVIRATGKGIRGASRRRQGPDGRQKAYTRQFTEERRRIKISVTVSPSLLAAVDAEAKANGTNRSRVIDEALVLWHAEQRRQALARQYTTPLTEAQQEEDAAWNAILDVAAEDMLADAANQ